MWLMMQHDKPDDWVLATGETYSVKNFLEEAFGLVSLDWQDFVLTDKKYERPNEVNYLCGDPTKAKNQLGWEPEVNFKELVKKMVESDINLAEREKVLIDNKLLSPSWEYPIKA
jgi:GDPmannose 4,6-dehydratase